MTPKTNADTGRLRRFVRRALVAVAVLSSAPLANAQTEQVTYYHVDAAGSVRMTTDASGQVTARYDYLPFGGDWPDPPGGQESRRFAAKEHDQVTGFEYFGGRYYASGNGRFTTVDPALDFEQALVNPQQWNRYAYALNNPLKFTDPDGRNPLLVGGAIGASVYAAWNTYQNVQQGRPWYENIGVEASKGFLIGATLGLAAPALAGTTMAEIGLTSTAGTAGAAANALGMAREAYVARLVGGRVAGDVKITLQDVGSTAIDVYGKAGEFIGVGGPAKGVDLSQLGTKLKVLAGAAEQAGVKAQYYLQKGTSMEAFRLAEKWLGEGNVHWYELPQ